MKFPPLGRTKFFWFLTVRLPGSAVYVEMIVFHALMFT